MASILENLRNLSQKSRTRRAEATDIAERIRKAAEAAHKAGQEKGK